MRFYKFEIGAKFEYNGHLYMVLNEWFDTGFMIVNAIRIDKNRTSSKFIRVYQIYDNKFTDCKLIESEATT